MARVNLEEKWWSDPRRGRLIEKLGSALLADGLMVNIWRASQEHNAEPFEWAGLFDEKHIVALASVCLAKDTNGKLYVKGAKEHHDWLVKKREAAAKGGKSKSNKNKEKRLAHAKHSLDSVCPPTPTPAPTLNLPPQENLKVPDGKSSSQKNDDFYSPEKQKFKHVISEAFEGKIPPDIRNLTDKLFTAYEGDIKHFAQDLQAIVNKDLEDPSKLRGYIAKSLKNLAGAAR